MSGRDYVCVNNFPPALCPLLHHYGTRRDLEGNDLTGTLPREWSALESLEMM